MKRMICTVLAGLLAAPVAFGQADKDIQIVDLDNQVDGFFNLSDGGFYEVFVSVDRTEDGNRVFGTTLPDDACVEPGVCAIVQEQAFTGGGGFSFSQRELARSEYAIGANVNTAMIDFFSDALGEQVNARWTRVGPVGENTFSFKQTPGDGAEQVLHTGGSNESALATIDVRSSGPLLIDDGAGFLAKNTRRTMRIILP